MPYGLGFRLGFRLSTLPVSIPHMGCMPYGRSHGVFEGRFRRKVSIPHMGCMPYGRATDSCPVCLGPEFQSLIWVACPTGKNKIFVKKYFEIVSIPHMGCMPYGRSMVIGFGLVQFSFNPSYGLHALRAARNHLATNRPGVSIPHMGCMPYGPKS